MAASRASLSLDLSCSTKKKIAVLGVTANPITDAHIKCACEIVHMKKAEEVWVVPCGERPDKPSLQTPYLHRLMMCHLAVNTTFGSQFPVRVCDEEMSEPQALPTIILIRRLQARYPDKEFTFVVGADNYEQIATWDLPDEPGSGQFFFENGKFLVMERPGYDLAADALPSNFDVLQAGGQFTLVTQENSSSEMRRRINFGDSERDEISAGNFEMVDGLLNPAVLAHIIRYGLYRK